MNNEFIKAVEEKKIKTVRMMLSNELLLDPRGETFGKMLQYSKENLDNLFEPNEPARFEIPTNKEEWTDEVVSKMKRDLNMNFSIEKLSLFAEMAKWTGRDKAQQLDKEVEKQKNKTERTNNNGKSAAIPKRKTINKRGIFVTTSGAILTVVGLCAGKTLITLLGGMVVIGGVVLIVTRKEDEK